MNAWCKKRQILSPYFNYLDASWKKFNQGKDLNSIWEKHKWKSAISKSGSLREQYIVSSLLFLCLQCTPVIWFNPINWRKWSAHSKDSPAVEPGQFSTSAVGGGAAPEALLWSHWDCPCIRVSTSTCSVHTRGAAPKMTVAGKKRHSKTQSNLYCTWNKLRMWPIN